MKKTFDPDFGTAAQGVEAMRQGVISSRELTSHVFARIKKHNPRLNLFITLLEEQAMARAGQADELLAKKNPLKPLGSLHGLPVSIKDVYATEGVRTTSGSKTLEAYVPKEDAVAVARLKAAGAIIVGKTNMPEFAADYQAFNDIVGTSNNPWDVTRTPGGSTGGGAAALAAGLSFLELGGDLNGSIRLPCHFCGVYGHKPTIDVVPVRGHIPPPPGVVGVRSEFSVAGPLARSPEDLQLALEVIAGPDVDESVAYRWRLPPARENKLRDYRIGYVIDDPLCAVDPAVKEVLSNAIDSLAKSGVALTQGWPPGVDGSRQNEDYGWLLAAFLSQTMSDAEFKKMQQSAAGVGNPWTKGMTSVHRDWLAKSAQRLKARAVWQDYFKEHDAFLMPVAFVAAFPHDHTPDMGARKLMTSKGERPYDDIARWISFPTLTGCPATAVPVGRTKGGLPVGLQIMGPFLEDGTPLDIAAKLAQVYEGAGFVAPSGFAA